MLDLYVLIFHQTLLLLLQGKLLGPEGKVVLDQPFSLKQITVLFQVGIFRLLKVS